MQIVDRRQPENDNGRAPQFPARISFEYYAAIVLGHIGQEEARAKVGFESVRPRLVQTPAE